jgi:hypothetical protein
MKINGLNSMTFRDVYVVKCGFARDSRIWILQSPARTATGAACSMRNRKWRRPVIR